MANKTRTPEGHNSAPFWQFCQQAETPGEADLYLIGEISARTWYGDEVTPRQFREELKALGNVNRITVHLYSGGGDVFAAQAIGDALAAHPAEVVCEISGICASAATLIACKCNRVKAASDSEYMIHLASVSLYGSYNETQLAAYQNALAAIKKNNIDLYCKRSGKTAEEIEALLQNTTWWTAREAMENGFVDEITESAPQPVQNIGGALFTNSVPLGITAENAPRTWQSRLAAPAPGGLQNTNTEHSSARRDNPMENITTIEQLEAAYPDLMRQVREQAANAATAAERQRIADIEDMTLPGGEAVAQEAKFTNPVSADAYARNVIAAAKAQGTRYMAGARQDAQTLDGVPGTAGAVPQTNQTAAQQEFEKALDAAAGITR